MRTSLKLASLAFATLAGVTATLQHAQGQTASAFEGSRITHVGVIVHDAAKTVQTYREVFGLPVSDPVHFKGTIDFPRDFTGDRDAHPKYSLLTLANVGIEVMQPEGGASPWREYLEKYGQGLHHIAFSVKDVHQAIAQLQALGGKLELGGSPGVGYAYVNFRDRLGFTIELSQMPTARPDAPSAVPSSPPAQADTALLGTRISHIGIFVPDVEKTARLFAAILGTPAPEAKTYPGIVFPKGFTGDPNAHPKIITFPMNAGVEFAEPQGGKSPWRDYVDKYGPAMHHLGISAKVGVPDTVAAFEKKGGTVLLRAPTGVTTFVDLKPEPMALAIELGSPPKN